MGTTIKTKEKYLKKLTQVAETVLLEKGIITHKDEWDDVLHRIAKNIASVEEPSNKDYWEDKFYNIMADNYFLPNFPTLRNGSREDGQIKATLSGRYNVDVSQNSWNWVLCDIDWCDWFGDYRGDSVANMVSDVLFTIFGLIIAWYLPPKSWLPIIIVSEILTYLIVNDNITKNMYHLFIKYL